MKNRNLIRVAGIILLTLILSVLPIMAACAKPAPAPPPTPAPTPAPKPAPAPAPPAEVIKMTSACYLPPVHRFSAMQEEFGKEIERRTNGRVEVTFYPGGSLLKAPKMHEGIIQGIADIGFCHTGYSRGRFPVTSVFELPLGGPTGWVISHVANDFYDKYNPEEWDDVHVILLHCANAMEGIHTTTKAVRKLEDLKGLTIRATGRGADAIAALGGTPRDVPAMECYEAMSKGVIDGFLGSHEVLKAFKFAEVCKYSTFPWQIGSAYVFYLIMNKDKWESLPKDIQQIFNEVSEEYREKFAVGWNEIGIEGMEYTLSLGNEIIELTPEEAARWTAAVEPVVDKYVEDMVAEGFSEKEIREMVEFIKERNEYWTKKETELGIPSPLDVEIK